MAHKKSKRSKKLPTADFTVTSVAASLGQEIDANSILNYLM